MGSPAAFSLNASAMDRAKQFLEQYGVKGQKWGVRRDRPGPSDDAVRVEAAKSTIKRGGTQALSNKELQDVVTRMNLETQYGRLSAAQKSKGRKFVEKLFLGDPNSRRQLDEFTTNTLAPAAEGVRAVRGVGDTITRTDLSGIGR